MGGNVNNPISWWGRACPRGAASPAGARAGLPNGNDKRSVGNSGINTTSAPRIYIYIYIHTRARLYVCIAHMYIETVNMARQAREGEGVEEPKSRLGRKTKGVTEDKRQG